MLDTPTPLIAQMSIRKARIHKSGTYNKRGTACASEVVQCADGDVANLYEIDGIDFQIINQDLIEYIAHTF